MSRLNQLRKSLTDLDTTCYTPLIKEMEVHMTEQGGEVYLTADEAAKFIGITRRTLDRYAASKRIPRYRRGIRNVVFKQSDAEILKQDLQDIKPDPQ
jgi:excisionase family DNA binding protein